MAIKCPRKLLFLWFILFSISIISNGEDAISPTQSIKDNETISSADGQFEMGFFSPGVSKNRYVGIWYKKISAVILTVVWVANRENPILDSSGVLMVSNEGNLTLVNGNGTTIWSTNSTGPGTNPIAQLLDSGNLVVRSRDDDKPENYLWQSFDYIGDTLLPGMKLGTDLKTGKERHMIAWKSSDDPSRGDYQFNLDPRGFPQLTISKKDSMDQYCSGPWNGLKFSGSQYMKPNPVYKYYLVFDQNEVYYGYGLVDNAVITRLVINPNGVVQRFVWINRTQKWESYLTAQSDYCDTYASCGAHGNCNIDAPKCRCLQGFVPKDQNNWALTDWSQGCVRKTPFDCEKGEKSGFRKYSKIKLPDARKSWFNRTMTLEECKVVCLRNCSCMAYTSLDISSGREGSGCLLWFGDLIDIREYTQSGQDIYIRISLSDIDNVKKKKARYNIVYIVLSAMLLLGLSITLYVWKKKNQAAKREGPEESKSAEYQEDLDLPFFEYDTIARATDNFSTSNKIGEGGFGPVYKGTLIDGQEIAVKMLSKNSIQGHIEFKNEVICIVKLQHRNLVKLLGCCIHVEMMLIYEYMPNRSLDFFIFDKTKRLLLDWPKRFNIIYGISRGLLYLHQDSRLRIIHRDLKAGNILLDHEMNPKISDFGMARSFGGNETEAETTRVVGTYGYMSPEYQIDGFFSVKSDVFSFGVLVLEIVSAKKNRGFQHEGHFLNLLGHGWKLYQEGRSFEMLDASLEDSCNHYQVLRSIHVGLLCVQQNPEDRPSMLDVVMMLSSDGALPHPTQPGFFNERFIHGADQLNKNDFSTPEMTVSLLSPR